MNSKKLLKRQIFVEGRPLKDRASPRPSARRDSNHVVLHEEENSEYGDFFDFEEDLAEMKPANEQAAVIDNERPPAPMTMEPDTFVRINEDNVGKLVIEPEEAPETIPSNNFVILEIDDRVDEDISSQNKPNYMNVKGFKFNQCLYIKKNDERCKRQAPKKAELCSIHRRMEKNKEN